jgi:hypothetical protein
MFAVACLALAGGPAAHAQSAPAADGSDGSGGDGFVARWFDRVNAAQASQPHWITPLVTVTPRLEQEFRFDAGFQQAGNGAHVDNYGMGKGLELIPTTTNEVILNLPPYETRSVRRPAQGFGDDPVLLIKQRLLSANEENGDYIVTAFFGVQAPTGAKAFTSDAWVVTPTIAGGKGWGPFNVQATLGVAYPLTHTREVGTSVINNVAFQYHVRKVFWPEFEVNTTYWSSGPRQGKTQVYLTPGIIFGRFPIVSRIKAIVGVGYQFAVSPKLVTTPVLTPIYDRQLILTTRFAF